MKIFMKIMIILRNIIMNTMNIMNTIMSVMTIMSITMNTIMSIMRRGGGDCCSSVWRHCCWRWLYG